MQAGSRSSPSAVHAPGGGAGAQPAARSLTASSGGASPGAGGSSGSSNGGGGSDEPPSLNAFEVVSLFGGMALSRLLEVVGSGSGSGSIGSSSGGGSAEGAGAGARRAPAGTTTAPQFLSLLPARTILDRLAGALADMQAEVRAEPGSYKVKGTLASSKGAVSLVAVVHRLGDETHLVELRRGKGDTLEYYALAGRLRERVDDIVARPR